MIWYYNFANVRLEKADENSPNNLTGTLNVFCKSDYSMLINFNEKQYSVMICEILFTYTRQEKKIYTKVAFTHCN